MTQLDSGIFKAYDIRGVVGSTLTEHACRHIGQAFATLVRRNGETAVHLSRDGRLSGPALAAALAQGLRAGGVDVIDLGMNATPMLYYACATTPVLSGIQLTGSHNPPQYNGLKMVLGGNALFGAQIQELRELTLSEAYASGTGAIRQASIVDDYIGHIVGDVRLARPMHVVVDCGSGVSGAFAPRLLRELGCTVHELYCTVDGRFPHHHPDPADPHNLQDLIDTVRRTGAELGLAFDGDGDRLGVVTPDGQIIWPDRQLMLYAADVLQRHPGAPILYDVKCTARLPAWVRQHGGEPVMGRTGHSLVKAKMKDIGAPLAGEMSGHIFFKDRWFGSTTPSTAPHACWKSSRAATIPAPSSRRCPTRCPRRKSSSTPPKEPISSCANGCSARAGFRERRRSAPSTACVPTTPTASVWRGRRTPRRAWCCVSKATTRRPCSGCKPSSAPRCWRSTRR